MKRISKLSAYARPDSNLAVQTAHGALVTLLGVGLALFLFINEVSFFFKLTRTTKMSVDTEMRRDLSIFLDMSLPAVPCAVLSLDAMDVAGTNDNDASSGPGLHMSIHKIRLDADGKKVGKAEYHTPGSQTMVDSGMGGASVMNVNIPQAMKHLVDMEEESDHREGCHVSGTMAVKRVAGRIHISVHQQLVFQMLPQLLGGHHIPHVYNMSHTIHTLSFGPKYPGLVNPLDATTRLVEGDFKSFKYFIKVVPTEYYGRLGGVTETNQFSLTEYSGVTDTKMNQPSIELMYDISPIVVNVNDHPPSILHFITRMCAVIGGVFAITRLVDKLVNFIVT